MTILVIAEHDGKALAPATLNTVAAAAKIGGDIHVLVAGQGIGTVAEAAAQIAGVAKVLVADNAAYAHQLPENVAPLVAELGAGYSHILAGATSNGKNILPRVAAALDVDQISEIISVVSADTFTRPIYAGNAIATVQSTAPVKVITVRATGFDPVAAEGGSAAIEAVSAAHDAGISSFVGEELAKSDRPELTAAKIVVSGGRGMQNGDNFKHLYALADKLGAPLVARIIAEVAHSQTGVDIHPGAVIGSSFFIDHGTGVVIGETAIIGQRVRLYQAVTLGAKRFPADASGVLIKGTPRHPIVEDDVVIYAGATVLGRITVGRGSSVGGNVWLTRSLPPGSHRKG